MKLGTNSVFTPRRVALLICVGIPALVLAFGPLGETSEAVAGKNKEGRLPFRVDAKMARKIELGRRLFYDKAVSQTQTQACVDCHSPNHGFSDPGRFSMDERGLSPRHSQPILNTANNPSAHWDGEFDSVEHAVEARIGRPLVTQYYGIDMPVTPTRPTPTTPRRRRPTTTPPSTGPMAGGTPLPPPTTMPPAFPTIPNRRFGGPGSTASTPVDESVAVRLEQSKRYKEAFKAVYGSRSITVKKIADAMAAYCHSIESTDAKYDMHMKGSEAHALSPAELRGQAIFKGKGQCASCHKLTGAHPLLSDYAFHNTGIAFRRQTVERGPQDFGRRRFTQDESDLRAFKTPTLRDAELRPPYMHDGSMKTLADAVRYYGEGGSSDPLQDKRITRWLSADKQTAEREIADVVAFLKTLTGIERPGQAKAAWNVRAKEQKLTFVNQNGKAVHGLDVTLVPHGQLAIPAGDEYADRKTPILPTPVRHRVERRDGQLRVAPSDWTHYEVQLEDGLIPAAIPLIPDTSRSVKITVPVEGRIEIVVISNRAPDVAELLTASPSEQPLPARTVRNRAGITRTVPAPVMRLRLTSDAPVKLGKRWMGRYEAWVPTGWTGKRLYVHEFAAYKGKKGVKRSFEADSTRKGHVTLDLTKSKK